MMTWNKLNYLLLLGAFFLSGILAQDETVNPREQFFHICKRRSSTCFGNKPGCSARNDCDFEVAIMPEDDNRNKYDFMVMSGPRAEYVAVGLSLDDKMGDDSIVECIHPGPKSKWNDKVRATWSPPRGSESMRPVELPDKDARFLSKTNLAYIDGRIFCNFTREAKSVVRGTEFDMIRDPFYVLLAQGQVGDKKIEYHAENNRVVSPLINFKMPTDEKDKLKSYASPIFHGTIHWKINALCVSLILTIVYS